MKKLLIVVGVSFISVTAVTADVVTDAALGQFQQDCTKKIKKYNTNNAVLGKIKSTCSKGRSAISKKNGFEAQAVYQNYLSQLNSIAP